MCGNEGSIRIEPKENGFTIDAYVPSEGGKPGKNSGMVASDGEHVLRLLKPHLVRIGKKRRARGRLMEHAAESSPKKRIRRKRS